MHSPDLEGDLLTYSHPVPKGLLVIQVGTLRNYVGSEIMVVELQAALLELHVSLDLATGVFFCGLEAALGVGELAVFRQDFSEFAEPLHSLLLL